MSLPRERELAREEILSLVIAAQEAERARVARDLHDEIGQALTGVLLGLHLVDGAVRADPVDVARVAGRITDVRELVADALRRVRRLAWDLRPTVLDDLGLGPALSRLVDDVAERHPVAIAYDQEGLDGGTRLPSAVETVAYRVVQEALTNVVRHAAARHASVDARVRGGVVHVVVTDDGNGFDVDSCRGSLGLRGMVERAHLAGGHLKITSLPGSGTTVELEVPVGEPS